MGKKDKKNKKKKVEEKVMVEVKVDEPETIVEPEPKEVIEVPDDMKELWIDGEVDSLKKITSLLNDFVKRGYTADGDWEHNFRTGLYEYLYKIKKAG